MTYEEENRDVISDTSLADRRPGHGEEDPKLRELSMICTAASILGVSRYMHANQQRFVTIQGS